MPSIDFSTIKGVEEFIQSLDSGRSEIGIADLETPRFDVGALGAAIQGLATWAKTQKGVLRIRPTGTQSYSEYFKQAFSKDLNLVACVIANEIRGTRELEDIHDETMRAIRVELERRQSKKFAINRGAHVMCVRNPYVARRQGSPIDFDLNEAFFRLNDSSFVESLRGFDEPDSLLPKCVEQAVMLAGLPSGYASSPNYYDLQKALFELFENANVWGLVRLGGMELERNVRGLYACYHPTGASHGDFLPFGELKRLQDYYFNFVRREDEKKLQGFLEFSVYDCGPGLPAMMLRNPLPSNISPSKEYELIMDCLKLRGTSSDSANRGKGLHVVFTKLSELEGFLLIRTGRFSVCRDFAASKFNPDSDQPYKMNRLFDAAADRKRMTVVGSLFVLVIPIWKNANEQTSLGF